MSPSKMVTFSLESWTSTQPLQEQGITLRRSDPGDPTGMEKQIPMGPMVEGINMFPMQPIHPNIIYIIYIYIYI